MRTPRHHTRTRTLAPYLRDRFGVLWRGSGFGRTVLVRRIAAALLVGLAAVLALRPGAGTTEVPVVVAGRDLPPGTVLGAEDVLLRGLPPQAVPDGTASSTAAVLDRTIAAPVRRGEPVTDVRLTGPDLAHAVSADPTAVSVPLRLPDPDIAVLLHPGAVVDVVTLGARQGEPVVLAHGARVLAVLESGTTTGEGRLVLVSLEPAAATRVAAASLTQSLTVTVR